MAAKTRKLKGQGQVRWQCPTCKAISHLGEQASSSGNPCCSYCLLTKVKIVSLVRLDPAK
jgi:hypothetical protein